MERIPSAAEFRNAAGIRKLQDKNVRQGFDDELLYIDDDSFRKLHEFCVNRTATPKCILCGNSSYVEIDLYKRETGLNHDQCWGSPILAQGIIVGGSVGPPDGRVRFLNRDGKLLWATTNSYKMYQYWLKAVLHVPATHPDGTNFRTTINAIVNGELDTALKILKPYCESGDVSGLSIMGALHYIGKGVEHDGIRARDLLNVAMEQGDLGACHNLASLYCTGAPGIERDVANGWKLFHRAKKVGAQFELDDFFKKGQDDYYPYYRPNQ